MEERDHVSDNKTRAPANGESPSQNQANQPGDNQDLGARGELPQVRPHLQSPGSEENKRLSERMGEEYIKSSLLSPSQSLASPLSRDFSTAKKMDFPQKSSDGKSGPHDPEQDEDEEQGDHPLSVYFKKPVEDESGMKMPRNREELLEGESKGSPTPSRGQGDSESHEDSPLRNTASLQETSASKSRSARDIDESQVKTTHNLSMTGPVQQSKLVSLESSFRSQQRGLASLGGSAEQSPNTKPGGPHQPSKSITSYKSPRSQHPSSEANSSSKHQSNPADNYQFLGGIREVDDDQESMSQQTANLAGTIGSSHKQAKSGSSDQKPHFFRGQSMQNESVKSSQGAQSYGPKEDEGILYGTIQAPSSVNPFIHNGSGNVFWSSGKDQLSERQPSFGGDAVNTPSNEIISESSPSRNMDFHQNSDMKVQEFELGHRPSASMVERALTRNFNQALAHMGEKACMRLALKEVSSSLDTLNELMCKQSVQQELILNDDTPQNQLRQIMEMSLQRDSQDLLIVNRVRESRTKTNVQLIDSIRMESQMMAMRFKDYQNREENIYTRFIKERERNMAFEAEFQRLERQAPAGSPNGQAAPTESARLGTSLYHNTVLSDWIDTENLNKSQANLANFGPQGSRMDPGHPIGAKDMHNRNFSMKTSMKQNQLTHVPSIEQLSPGSPFNVRRSPIEYTPSPGKKDEPIQSYQVDLSHRDGEVSLRADSHNQSISHLKGVRKALEEKDKQIRNLLQYVDAMKKEFSLYRQTHSQRLSLQVSHDDSPQTLRKSDLQREQDQHEKILELHAVVYELQAQNQCLEDQLDRLLPQSNIRVEDGLANLQRDFGFDANELKHLNQDSSSSKEYSPSAVSMSPSYMQSVTVKNPGSQHIGMESQHGKRNTYRTQHYTSNAHQSSRIRVGGASLEEPSSQTHAMPDSMQKFSGSSPSKVNELFERLDVQARISKKLDENENVLLQKLKIKDLQFSDLQELTQELQNQNKVNSEALEKAGIVIQKLNEDASEREEALKKLQAELEVVKGDNLFNRQQMENQLRSHQQKEQGMESKLQRTDNEYQLEVKELCDRLQQLQSEHANEKHDFQTSLKQLEAELGKQQAINTSLEQKAQADQAKANSLAKVKSNEILDYHNKNLSLQIQMQTVESQTRQDLEMKQDLHHREVLYLKNQTNKLDQQIRTMTQSSQSFADRMESHKHVDQDGTEIPKINGAYLAQLTQEFGTLSDELQTLRELVGSNSVKSLESYVHQHTQNFSQFKLSVLDNLIDWHQKSTGLAGLATRYLDTLEEYKMMFVQMKQLLKEKDGIIRKTKNQMDVVKEKYGQHFQTVQKEYQECNSETLGEFRDASRGAESNLGSKEAERCRLIRYQEEFRDEYIQVCAQREDLLRRNESFVQTNDRLIKDLERVSKSEHELREDLKRVLEIQDGPHCYQVIPQHAQMIMDNCKAQRAQNLHLQEKVDELTLELDKQRALFKTKMDESQRQLEDSQAQYLQGLDEAGQDFFQKEQRLESQVAEMTMQIQSLTQEAALRDRQMRKHEAKMEVEIKKQVDLQVETEYLVGEKNRILEGKDAISKSFDVLEEKLHRTQECLDERSGRLEALERQSKEAQQRAGWLEVEKEQASATLREKEDVVTNANKQVERQKAEIQSLQDQLHFVKTENARNFTEASKLQMNEKCLIEANEKASIKITELEDEVQRYLEELGVLQQETRRYEGTVSFMSRQLDQEKLKLLDSAILEAENRKLKDTITLKEEVIAQLRHRYVDCPRSEGGCQTDDRILVEGEMLRNEVVTLRGVICEHEDEVVLVREAMMRHANDVDRLIDEKRQLEVELQESQARERTFRFSNRSNENVNQSNMHAPLRQRSGSPEPVQGAWSLRGEVQPSKFRQQNFVIENNTQLGLVLNEKDNYINRLETELNELRIENERLKDKLIIFELDNLERSTNLGNTQQHARTYKTAVTEGQRGGDLAFHSTQDKTQADSRSNGTQNHVSRMLAQPAGPWYESNFGRTQQYPNHLPLQDAQHQAEPLRQSTFDLSQNVRSLTRNGAGANYQTHHVTTLARSPHHGGPELATPRLDQDNEQFYTLHQVQAHNVRSEGGLDDKYLDHQPGSRYHDTGNSLPSAAKAHAIYAAGGSSYKPDPPSAAANYHFEPQSQFSRSISPLPAHRGRETNLSSIQDQDSRLENHEGRPAQMFRNLARE